MLPQVIWFYLQTSTSGSRDVANLNQQVSLSPDCLTWLVLDVVLGTAFRRHFAQIHFLVEDLHLLDSNSSSDRHLKITEIQKALKQ